MFGLSEISSGLGAFDVPYCTLQRALVFEEHFWLTYTHTATYIYLLSKYYVPS